MKVCNCKIGDIALVVTKGTTPTTLGKSFTDSGINFIKAEALNGDSGLDTQGFGYIDEDTHTLLERSILQVDDVLITIAGVNVGKCGYVQEKYLPANTNQAVGIIRINKEKALPRFVYYFFKQESIAAQLLGLSGQAAQPNLNLTVLKTIRISLPYLTVQQQIASILSAYDDLIENNRKRMALLEESVRELYKEWFVRLRFPGCEHTKIISGVPARRSAFRHAGVPEGWEKKTLGQLCAEIRDIVSPEDIDPDTPYIGLEHIPRRSITLDEWGYASDVTSSKHRFVAGDILFGKIRPYFHKVGIALLNGVASSDAIVIRANELNWSLVLLTVSSNGFVADTSQRMKEGSKMPRADWKQMQQYTMLTPPETLMKSLNAIVKPITDQLRVLAFQSKNLAEARDMLLPKLMNGEIEI